MYEQICFVAGPSPKFGWPAAGPNFFECKRLSGQILDDMNLSGKTYLVIGASSGIGLSLAHHLQAQGATVITAGRRIPAGLAPAMHLHFDAQTAQGNEFDGLDMPLDGLAYCPGSITLKPFHRLTNADFLQDFQVNVLGAATAIRAALPRLKQSETSSVVLYSTVAVGTGMGFHASIAAAKGAVEGLARSLAAEFAPSRIRVNVVAPSLTETPLAAALLSTPEKKEASAKRHPLGRIGTAYDIAALSAFLLSPDAGWITGQVIGADGGMSALRPL